jgi:hypothetical protein
VANVNSITFTTTGGSQTVTDSAVTLMTRMTDAFYVEGKGSTLLLDGVVIERNQMPSDPWTAVSARTEAIAQISASAIANNSGLEFGVTAFSATVTIQDSFIQRNVGSVSLAERNNRAEFRFFHSNIFFVLFLTGFVRYSKCPNFCNYRRSIVYKSSRIKRQQ